ncbi:MAG: mannosyltransferase family protein [Patescibacteria group bacterium]
MGFPKIVLLFISSRILFLLFASVASYFIPLDSGYIGKQIAPATPYLSWIWANFDGRHFINIAKHGYQNFDFAFFPLYPFLISLFNFLDPLYVGIFISCISFVAALYFLYKLTKVDYSEKIASLAVFFACFYPLSFFYHSVYSDSLFFLLTILSFYLARKRNWVWAGFFAALASMTRLSGIVLVPALLVEWYLQNKNSRNTPFKKALPGIALGTLGIGGYMLALNVHKGDPLLFQKSFSAWNQAGVVLPFQVIYRYIKIFLSVSPKLLVYWVAVLEFVTLGLYLLLGLFVWRKIRASYGLFIFLLLLLVPITGTFAGTPRYLLHLFPGFIALSLIAQKRPLLQNILIVMFVSLGFVLTAIFTRGYFVS